MWFIFLPLILILAIMMSNQLTGFSQEIMIVSIIVVLFFTVGLGKMMYDKSLLPPSLEKSRQLDNNTYYREYFSNYYPIKNPLK